MSNTPAILIQFDDGNASDHDAAFAYMSAKGMYGTSYIIQNNIGTAGYLTEANLATMNTAGWDIANHTTDHTDLTTLVEADQETKINDCITYLDGLGLTRASRHIAYPFGVYNADTLTAMTNVGALTGRGAAEITDTLANYAASWYELPSGTYNAVGHLITLYFAKAFVDDCKCRGEIGIITFHRLVASSPILNDWLVSDFQALIDYIYDNKIPTLTISQLYGLHSAPLVYPNPWYVV